jgi:hypothetical protein
MSFDLQFIHERAQPCRTARARLPRLRRRTDRLADRRENLRRRGGAHRSCAPSEGSGYFPRSRQTCCGRRSGRIAPTHRRTNGLWDARVIQKTGPAHRPPLKVLAARSPPTSRSDPPIAPLLREASAQSLNRGRRSVNCFFLKKGRYCSFPLSHGSLSRHIMAKIGGGYERFCTSKDRTSFGSFRGTEQGTTSRPDAPAHSRRSGS